MRVIGISVSSRIDGNTAIIIDKVLSVLKNEGIDTKLVQLANLTINPCKACFACAGKGNCIHKNDDFNEMFEQLKQSQGIVLGSPTYSANISAKMQAFLERAAVVADVNPGLLKHKVGVAVATARRGGALFSVDAMNHFFLNHEMFVAGSTYWNIAYGQMSGSVTSDEEGMHTMVNLGENMKFLLRAIESHQ